MPLVSASALNALRAVGYRGLDTPVTIKRTTQVESDFGSTEQETVIAETMGWFREMKSTAVGEDNYLIANVSTFRLHLAVDTDIAPGDQVVVNGNTYEVNEVNSDNTLRVFCTATVRIVA